MIIVGLLLCAVFLGSVVLGDSVGWGIGMVGFLLIMGGLAYKSRPRGNP